MGLRISVIIGSILIGLTSFSTHAVFGQTRLGLYVTQEELNIWKQRAAIGPYKNAGDVSTNSPGDWTTISNNASQNLANSRWYGYTGTGCVPNDASLGSILPAGDYIRDAAFAYLLTGTTSYRTAVLNELVAQAGVPGVNFADRSKWCVFATNSDNFFRAAVWLTKYAYTWDYILAGDTVYGNTVGASDRNTIEAWLLGGATYFASIYNTTMGARFVGRLNDNYTLTPEWARNCATDFSVIWYGTPIKMIPAPANRDLAIILPAAMIGIQQNNSTLKDYARRAFKEYFWFGVRSDNTPLGDMYRWVAGGPTLGLIYTNAVMGILGQIADAFARVGDRSLYDYTTSTGQCGTSGGPKSFFGVLNEIAKMIDHTYLRYGTDQAGNNGNPAYLIDTDDGVSGGRSVLDHVFAQPNVYYQSNYLKAIYMRTAPGQNGYTLPGYPSNPATGGYYAWGNAWGMMPGNLFMFGQMEGKVWPYSTGGSQLPTINLTADPGTIAVGQSFTLSWSTANVDSCSASDGWTGTKATSGTQTFTPTQTTSYTLTCTGLGASAAASTNVTALTPMSADIIAINAGGSSYTAPDGIVYAADMFYTGGGSRFISASSVNNTNADALYQTERYGNFSYAIPVANGDYALTLQFAELYWDAPGKRIFDVFVEGTERTSNVDIYAVAGKDNAYDITLPLKVTDGILNLDFRTDVDHAKLSALKLTKMSSPPPPPSGLVIRQQ